MTALRLPSGNFDVDSFRGMSCLSNRALFFLVLLVIVAHGGLGWMLLRMPAVRAALAESVPVFVYMVKPAVPQPEPRSSSVKPTLPVIEKNRPKEKLPPVAEKSAIRENPVEVLPIFIKPAPLLSSVTAASAVAPEPLAPPKTISISAVRYRKAPIPTYPMASKRLGETGETLVRVLIDQEGVAQRWVIEQSSGYERLDEAAIASIREASFYPYTENDTPLSAWVVIPISFNLR